MKVFITHGASPLARALATQLLERNRLTDSGGRESAIDRILLLDSAPAEKSADKRIRNVSGRYDDPSLLGELIDADYCAIFDLTTVGAVAGATLDAIVLLMEIIRETGHRPKLVVGTTLALDEAALPVLRYTQMSAIDGRVLKLAETDGAAAVAALIDAHERTAESLGDARFF
ncbi:Rossmann-fold NAD(P)-binding domain-containing protein [Derxia lacustris]|uniref:hypothetical protein n=1 Tax=Derxia lacustris TaxID=764842 RepID=UPI000A171C00|nr:hypothetical protein [Derxia lacustris]